MIKFLTERRFNRVEVVTISTAAIMIYSGEHLYASSAFVIGLVVLGGIELYVKGRGL